MEKLIKGLLNQAPCHQEEVNRAAKRGLIDFFAASALARNDQMIKNLLASESKNSPGPAQAIFQGQALSGRSAALIQGFQAHYRDMDDVHGDLRGHPSAVILPSLLTVCQLTDVKDIPAQRLLDAYVVGIELAARLGDLANPTLYELGWHTTATIGGLASSLAIAYLLSLDSATCLQMLSVVLSQAGGFRFQFGSDMKAMQAGMAARQAVDAYLLVSAGIQGQVYIFKDFKSWLANLGLVNTVDQPTSGQWKIVDPGLWFKAYPFCSAAYRTADAALTLSADYQIDIADIERVRLTFPKGRDAALVYRQPENGHQGQFSPEYIVLLALDKQRFEAADFAATKTLADYAPYFSLFSRSDNASTPTDMYAEIEIATIDGRHYYQKIKHPKGSPENPLSDSDLISKLKGALGKEKAQPLLSAIETIATMTLNNFIEIIYQER
ncbi:hypothetical protein AWM75_07540 [Aerococcus urinaehominis]|uniref:Uncharacterized protein n=1 Tax=Aerococcus urinaehominis TaxID=128944 RepID=A0A0X8FM32_9LACT|nr:MmgE/PrpD family protein [Aerococcus urinaehominis]AMB99826.1 hypothetical protein AWM75_07540 [Aerococcus urinaehominis]SDM55436.1 2-methylcitrate dehydratase PrpD [Aerococcus urinaehominis]